MATTSQCRAPCGTAFQQREMDIKTKTRTLMKEVKKHNAFYQVCFLSPRPSSPKRKEVKALSKLMEFRGEDSNSHL